MGVTRKHDILVEVAMKALKRAGMVVGLLLVASLIASSLLAISDQVKKQDTPPPGMAAVGCGGGCAEGGEGIGCAGAKAIAKMASTKQGCPMHAGAATDKPAAAKHECPKAAKGETCDPKSCEACAKHVATGRECPFKAEGGECDPAGCADCPHAKTSAQHSGPSGCPMHAGKDEAKPAAKSAVAKPAPKPADQS